MPWDTIRAHRQGGVGRPSSGEGKRDKDSNKMRVTPHRILWSSRWNQCSFVHTVLLLLSIFIKKSLVPHICKIFTRDLQIFG
jgi:hypothetical protein